MGREEKSVFLRSSLACFVDPDTTSFVCPADDAIFLHGDERNKTALHHSRTRSVFGWHDMNQSPLLVCKSYMCIAQRTFGFLFIVPYI